MPLSKHLRKDWLFLYSNFTEYDYDETSLCADSSECWNRVSSILNHKFMSLDKLEKAIFDKNNSNISYRDVFGFPIEEAYDILKDSGNGYLNHSTEIAFIVCYVFLSIFGLLGNLLVGFVLWRKKTLRTPRNLYIINLTISDIAMCLVSMPFTLIGLLYKHWGLGDAICKLIPVIQCTNILVSTSTIVAIATDRYLTIVSVSRSKHDRRCVSGSIFAIWLLSLVFTIPLYSYSNLHKVKIKDILLYEKCILDWPSTRVREIWTWTLIAIHYVIPLFVLAVVHARIKNFLSRHLIVHHDPRRAQRETKRNNKTILLLTSIAFSFGASWLPWHIVNILADYDYFPFRDPHYFYTLFGSAHIVAMTTVCTNPILYGWFNTNLRKDLFELCPDLLKALGFHQPQVLSSRGVTSKHSETNGEMKDPQQENMSLIVLHSHHTVEQNIPTVQDTQTSTTLMLTNS